MFGHAKFMLQQFDEALDAYYKAIRISNLKKEELKDNLVY